MIVREYQDGDQKSVIDLILEIQQKEFEIPIRLEDQPDLLRIPEFYQQGNGNFWVAVHEDQVVGTVSLVDIGNGQCALRKMFVRKAFRGPVHRTATLLLQALREWATERAVHDVYLGTTAKFLAAHRFYEKSGFDEISADDLPKSFPRMAVDTKFYRLKV